MCGSLLGMGWRFRHKTKIKIGHFAKEAKCFIFLKFTQVHIAFINHMVYNKKAWLEVDYDNIGYGERTMR